MVIAESVGMGYNVGAMKDQEKPQDPVTTTDSEEESQGAEPTEPSPTPTDKGEEESDEERVLREHAEYLDGWQRSQAEIQNLQKRHGEERALFTTLGKESLLQDLIPILDHFEAAMADQETWESVDENWRRGIEYIHQQFVETLSHHGVTTFGAVGDAFDTTLHEPVASEGQGENITGVRQKGYRMGERVVRPAKVTLG